jgi:hypothetical protein
VTIVRPEDFRKFEDGDDWAPACERALLSELGQRGVRLQLTATEYVFRTTLYARRGPVIEGCGGGRGKQANTRIVVLHGGDGIVIEAPGDEVDPSDQGAWTVLRDFSLEGPLATVQVGDGIKMRARARLENLSVEGFGRDSYHVESGYVGDAVANCNGFMIEHCQAWRAGRAGLFVGGEATSSGVNCSNGLVTRLDVREACRLTGSDDRAAGIVDGSYLGNVYVAPHVDGCKSADGSPRRGVLFDGDNNCALVLGLYVEDDCARSRAMFPATFLGAICKFDKETTANVVRASSGILRAVPKDMRGTWFRSDHGDELFLGPHRKPLLVKGGAPAPIDPLRWDAQLYPLGTICVREDPVLGEPGIWQLVMTKSGPVWAHSGILSA